MAQLTLYLLLPDRNPSQVKSSRKRLAPNAEPFSMLFYCLSTRQSCPAQAQT